LVSESEQVDVYFDVQQKTSRRIMLIATMLIKGYKKGSYPEHQEESVLKSIRHMRMTQKVNDSGNAYFVRRLLESLQADDMSSRELVHELETMVDVEHFTIDQEIDFWGVITSSEEESEDDQSNLSLATPPNRPQDGYHSDGLPLYELPRHMIVPLRILRWKYVLLQRGFRALRMRLKNVERFREQNP